MRARVGYRLSLRHILFGFFCAAVFVISPRLAHAQCAGICKPNEVLVDEDDDTCYCQDRQSYARCVADKGRRLDAERKGKCARVMQQCMRDNDLTLTFDAIACVAGCQTFAGCLPVCGVSGAHAWVITQQCFHSTTPCFEEALRNHKQGIELCKRQ